MISSLRCDSPILGYPIHPDTTDPLIHPHPLFTRILPHHIQKSSVLPPFASPTRRQSRFPSISNNARNAVYLSDIDIDVRHPPSPDLDVLDFPLPPISTPIPVPEPELEPEPAASLEPSRPTSLSSLAALAAPTLRYLADDHTNLESRWSHSSDSLHELDLALKRDEPSTPRKKLRSLISRLSGVPVALAILSPTSPSTSPISLSQSTSRSSSSAGSLSPTVRNTDGAHTAPPSPYRFSGFTTTTTNAVGVETRPNTSWSMDGVMSSIRGLGSSGDVHSNSRSTPNPGVTATHQPAYDPGTASDRRHWTRKSGGGGRRAYNPALSNTTWSRPNTPTGRGRSTAVGAGLFTSSGPVDGSGLKIGATNRSKSRLSLIGFRRNEAKDGDGSGKGKNKRMLVVSGLAPDDQVGFQAVKAWCEEFGELQSISRKENGSLHIDFRKRSVADTVCRVQAKVHIKGAGSISLSWYSSKKNL